MTKCHSCGETLHCRSCGEEYKGRRADGQGSFVPRGTPLSKNEATLLVVFNEAIKQYSYGCTIRQLQQVLFGMNPRPMRESGKDWNAHYIQADMSRLVGRRLVLASKMQKGNALLYTLPMVVSP
jgi:hypothetical protein